MKKLLTILLMLITFGHLSAEISVKSFRKLENDMTARIDAPKKDQNGDVCAIIKVVTTQTGFIWEPDGLGIVAAIPKVGEYWLYVPFGAKRLTIKHPQLGILRDYMYNMPIEKATVYEMVIVSGRVETTVVEEIISQWLLIKTNTPNALIYINEEWKKTGSEYQVKLKPGKYTYRVEAPLYHTEAGSVEITDTKKEMSIYLKPAFGYLNISTSPEQEATILIDGKPITQTTPCKTEAMASGEHSIQVMKEMFEPLRQKVTVLDGQTTPINLVLNPIFAELSIQTAANATIYLDNREIGKGQWQGRLSAGVYSLEARMVQHRTARQDIELFAKDKKSISLQPTPIYGTLDISTDPSGATITLDGKDYGTTPNTISKLLIGEYNVQLSKVGFASISRKATILESKSTEITETLSNGRSVTVNSTPNGIDLFIDGFAVGKTPYNGSLTFGNHSLRIENNGKKAEKNISIFQSGGEANFTLSFGPQNFTENLKDVSFDMVAVKGGTFMMGSEDGESDEKPVHSVTLSDFMIGKTEVNQAVWQAVMGNNPSNFKGDNLPVDNVSWNDCQLFITKLNKLTGKTYRLPTEAEWEYAAGGGASIRTKWAGTKNVSDVGTYAWYSSNSNNKTHIVATKKPNSLGLYDMSGNVCEWCNDWSTDYSIDHQKNPTGTFNGSFRSFRGGCWSSDGALCRSTFRNSNYPYYNFAMGLRLVFVP